MSEIHPSRTASPPDSPRPTPWWGQIPIAVDSWRRWQIGPLTLWVGRHESEWRIAWHREDDPFRDESTTEVPRDFDLASLPRGAEQFRVACGQTSEPLRLRPMVADRPVVARPQSPFSVPPGERISVFVSSALWVKVESGSRPDVLVDIPAWRPSDTWFGTNRAGFLAYATRTRLSPRAEDLPLRLHRAITPVTIDNRGADTLRIERLSLPAPNLSVFVGERGGLWTDRLHCVRENDAELARVHIDHDAPPQPGAELLSGPRKRAENSLLSRAFTGLFD